LLNVISNSNFINRLKDQNLNFPIILSNKLNLFGIGQNFHNFSVNRERDVIENVDANDDDEVDECENDEMLSDEAAISEDASRKDDFDGRGDNGGHDSGEKQQVLKSFF
jgi:hypothetical protein